MQTQSRPKLGKAKEKKREKTHEVYQPISETNVDSRSAAADFKPPKLCADEHAIAQPHSVMDAETPIHTERTFVSGEAHVQDSCRKIVLVCSSNF